ncbi:fatty acid desaturase 2-like isoform X2 [Gigantopelta aegis]|uniref:fatty acid desaturase 2-like isoform X2 n=1 Tax=Gigantopelta aegis TaxID=1735272 RepID=UPI001B889AB7|nr:fatty acid desaturase 2-like isoform X2 [Gigantopelta aegis]
MGKGSKGVVNGIDREIRTVTLDDVKQHDRRDDKWLVIQGEVYDITKWSKRHPGGSRLISHFAGQDATDAFRAFHKDLTAVRKYLKPIHIGTLPESERNDTELQTDFRELRKTAEDMGLFTPSILFFAAHLGHILMFEVLAYLVLAYLGVGWWQIMLSMACYTIVEAQTAWIQHDFGHLSAFSNRFSSKWDHLLHYLVMGFLQGASPAWWNHMHYQHHAKPNVMGKDPDVRIEKLFVVGKVMPVEVAKTKSGGSMPYNWQHRYFFIIGPPLLFPVYFQVMLFRHMFTRRLWWDLAVVAGFFIKFFYLYTPLIGFGGAVAYYFTVRMFESMWFTWVAQSNHIPMEIKPDEAEPWMVAQLRASCNVEPSFFNDWFTGHLNFQIEHHLFPTMPRHNLHKITPLVKSLCKKHGLDFQVKSLYRAFADIVKSLEHSGQLWYSTYKAYHSS